MRVTVSNQAQQITQDQWGECTIYNNGPWTVWLDDNTSVAANEGISLAPHVSTVWKSGQVLWAISPDGVTSLTVSRSNLDITDARTKIDVVLNEFQVGSIPALGYVKQIYVDTTAYESIKIEVTQDGYTSADPRVVRWDYNVAWSSEYPPASLPQLDAISIVPMPGVTVTTVACKGPRAIIEIRTPKYVAWPSGYTPKFRILGTTRAPRVGRETTTAGYASGYLYYDNGSIYYMMMPSNGEGFTWEYSASNNIASVYFNAVSNECELTMAGINLANTSANTYLAITELSGSFVYGGIQLPQNLTGRYLYNKTIRVPHGSRLKIDNIGGNIVSSNPVYVTLSWK